MSYYPGQGYHGGGGGGYGYAPPSGPPPPQHPPQGYGGQSGYQRYPPPRYPPPPGLDAYGYPLSQGHGYAAHARSGPPPPSAPQQFGHGAPEGYTFQYSNCTGRRKALLIGINYFGQEGELRGCINDVHNVSAFLVERYGYKREDMVILTDDQSNPTMQPTRGNIIRAMGWLVSNAQPNDALFLHYSGHGGQVEDEDGDEDDGYDECIYPVDHQQAGHIVDDEIHHYVVKPLGQGVRLTAIFDSCHSATVMDKNGGFMDAVIALARAERFIEYPDHHVTHLPVILYGFWIRLVSFLLTQFLHWVEKPLCHLGNCIEQILNLLSHNGGFLGIIFRVLTGRCIIRPQRDSETFRSAIGHLDPRLDLDKREITVLNGDCNSGTAIIQAGSRYCAEVCIMASKLAYENELFIRNVVTKRWKMHFVEFFNCWNNYLGRNSTQAFIFCDKPVDARLVVVAFRGTGPFDADDWITDFDFSWHKMGSLGKVHVGFLEAMGLANRSNKKIVKTPSERKRKDIIHDHDYAELPDEFVTEDEKKPLAYYAIRKKLSTLLEEHKDAKFIVTGHSLGGALAILFPAILLLHKKTKLMNKLLAVHTFGQPRVGDLKFRDFMNMNLNKPVTRYLRTVYCNDMIPRIPYDDEALSFKHCGVCLYYNSFYKQKMVKEVPNRNFSMLYYIPSMITATWELVYSLIMRYTKGKDFSEGWFALCFRFMGILLPGMSAHSPLNYVNAIRLGPAVIHTDLTVTDEDSDIDGIETPLISREEGARKGQRK